MQMLRRNFAQRSRDIFVKGIGLHCALAVAWPFGVTGLAAGMGSHWGDNWFLKAVYVDPIMTAFTGSFSIGLIAVFWPVAWPAMGVGYMFARLIRTKVN